jgi:hypothetical protein
MNEHQIEIRFPVFLIGIMENDHGRIASTIDGRDWLLLYSSQEVAELYIELANNPSLIPKSASGVELSEVLAGQPEVAGFLWNCLTSRRFQFLVRRDFEQ